MTTRNLTLVLMVLVAAFSRLIPHPWNFTAIGAIALFGGAHFTSRWASLVLPLAALVLSDFVLGLHDVMPFVYLGFLLSVVIGWALREERGAVRVGTYTLAASAIFFIVSNFGVWVMSGFYAMNLQGLIECYVKAIPFLGNQVAGDLFFTSVLFAGYAFAKKLAPQSLLAK